MSIFKKSSVYFFCSLSANDVLRDFAIKTHNLKKVGKLLELTPVLYPKLLDCLNLRRLIYYLWYKLYLQPDPPTPDQQHLNLPQPRDKFS